MNPLKFFKTVVGRPGLKVRREREQPPFPDRPGLFEDDIHRIAQETIDRKYGTREPGPAGRRLRQVFTNDETGQLPKADARRQPARTPAAGSAAATIATPAPAPGRRDLQAKIRKLKADIRGLEGKKK
jgi:hypothetical protein